MAYIKGRASGTVFKGYVEGGPQLQRAFANLEKATRDEQLVQVTQAGADVMADEWRSQARSKLGLGPGTAHYVEAINTRTRPGRNGATAIIGLGEVPALEGEDQPREYAAALEFGEGDRPAKPTLRPAFDAAKVRAVDAMGKKAWELIRRAN